MHSYKLEYLRFDNPKGGILIAGKPYLTMWGSNPVKEKKCPFDQLELLRILFKLRYENELKEKDRLFIIKKLSSGVKDFFVRTKGKDKYPVQIDLVLNANELGLLPFELILDEHDLPLFASRNRQIILTRRIRQDYFISKNENWPTVPRVLFAYANANYGSFHEVPFEEHTESLEWALRHWMHDIKNGNNKILKIIKDASFESLSEELINANNNGKSGETRELQPFTHLHILAHGALIPDPEIPNNPEYGVALFSKNKEPTQFKKITDLLKKLKNKPFVVSYMICDGANNFNPLRHERNIVQVTHEIGVPIVIGSQLPLSFEGSVQITSDFFTGIFSGKDVRKALHEVRCNLYENENAGHDWLSFVSYVRLPEGYEDYLEETTLKRELAALETIGKKSETLINKESATADDYEEIIYTLKERIDVLTNLFQDEKRHKKHPGIFEENAGLLGSAHKRWAELIFRRDTVLEKDTLVSFKEQEPILNQALNWYKKASDYNLSHHWSTVQYLSLQTVLKIDLVEQNYWYAALQSAMNDTKKKNEIWAFGSLAELYLLSPHREEKNNLQMIKRNIISLVKRAKKTNDPFPIESTRRQILRYVQWWTRKNGFNIPLNYFNETDLKEIVELLN